MDKKRGMLLDKKDCYLTTTDCVIRSIGKIVIRLEKGYASDKKRDDAVCYETTRICYEDTENCYETTKACVWTM